MRGLLKAAMDAGAKVTIKGGRKKKPEVARPKAEYNRRQGKGLDAYSPRRKRRNEVQVRKRK